MLGDSGNVKYQIWVTGKPCIIDITWLQKSIYWQLIGRHVELFNHITSVTFIGLKYQVCLFDIIVLGCSQCHRKLCMLPVINFGLYGLQRLVIDFRVTNTVTPISQAVCACLFIALSLLNHRHEVYPCAGLLRNQICRGSSCIIRTSLETVQIV